MTHVMQYQIAGYYSLRIFYTLNVIHFICCFKHYSIKLIILFILFSDGNFNPVTKKQQQVTTTKATCVSKRHQRTTTTISPAETQESQTQGMFTDETSVSTDVTTEEIQRYFYFEKCFQNFLVLEILDIFLGLRFFLKFQILETFFLFCQNI